MNPRSLEKNLANIERELVNLQTAHDIGLGLVKYYQYSGTSSTARVFLSLNIDVADGERPWPYMNVLIERRSSSGLQYSAVWQLDNDGTKFRAQCGGLGEYYIDWKIISTSRLIITEYEP